MELLTEIVREYAHIVIIAYFTVINLVAVIMTLYDKSASRNRKRRIKERTLLLVSLFGGAVIMLVTMRGIRHKTKHAKFMVGLPLIIILQIAVTTFIWWRLNGGSL